MATLYLVDKSAFEQQRHSNAADDTLCVAQIWSMRAMAERMSSSRSSLLRLTTERLREGPRRGWRA